MSNTAPVVVTYNRDAIADKLSDRGYLLLTTIRFWSKVDKDGPVPEHRPDLGPCWLWTSTYGDDGYGRFGLGRALNRRAHQVAYFLSRGPVEPTMQIDHLCRTRGCVNPDHLEAVTQTENIRRGTSPTAQNARKTHCKYGHPYDEANTHITRTGARFCRACARDRARLRYWKARGQ